VVWLQGDIYSQWCMALVDDQWSKKRNAFLQFKVAKEKNRSVIIGSLVQMELAEAEKRELLP